MKKLRLNTYADRMPILNGNRFSRYILIDEEYENEMYGYNFIPVYYDGDVLDYEHIIAAIVDAKYSNDDVTAITLNYLLAVHNEVDENKQEEYIREYKTLQEWRQKAKGIAKEVLEFAQKQNMI